MTHEEKEYISAAINYFWGLPDKVTADQINERVAETAYDALKHAMLCSYVMDLVPRPMTTPGATYAIKELVKIGARIASGDKEVYFICKAAVSYKFSTKIQEALRGL